MASVGVEVEPFVSSYVNLQLDLLEGSDDLSEVAEVDIDGTNLLIDLVFVYKIDDNQNSAHRRRVFQKNLRLSGLLLQEEKSQNFENDKLVFVKVHAPVNVLTNQADVMRLKKSVRSLMRDEPLFRDYIPSFMRPKVSRDAQFMKAVFREDISELFLGHEESLQDIFTPRERILIVWEVLQKTKFGFKDTQVGIRKLLSRGIYTAVYPLHDSSLKNNSSESSTNVSNRQILFQEWAHPASWYKTQPLDLIRNYYGDEIGIYFSWLGFYTQMLIPATIVGILCFIYGLWSQGSNFRIPSKEICDRSPGQPGSFVLCPACKDANCTFQILGDSCDYSELTYLFDNPATVAFAVFMSFWATMFLELWKRHQFKLVSLWGLTEGKLDLETRHEFEALVTTTRLNQFTGTEELALPFWNRFFRFALTFAGVTAMLFVVIIAFIAIIVYKISVAAALYSLNGTFFKDNSQILTSVTASLINLITILFLGAKYKRFAKWLTNVECHRTQSAYDTSYIFKIFVFQFVNCYSILIYIAFFKGKFYTHPGDDSMWSTFFGIGGDQCNPAGCVSELFIQLIVVMVGKQVFNNSIEIVVPLARKTWKNAASDLNFKTHWEQDFQLEAVGRWSQFKEMLEMVLQYGFLTLFVAVFPLAPLFALINNIIEIRLDAYKMTVQQRRPIPKRIASLGAWFSILQTITYLAVMSNAFVIAFTSEFIPQIFYMYSKSGDQGLKGYVNFSLSIFATKDYNIKNSQQVSRTIGEFCRYRGFRSPPIGDLRKSYVLTQDYWNILAMRLAFIVIFEHIVMCLTGLLAFLIPDLPWEVKEQLYMDEKTLEQQTLLHREHACKDKDA